MRKPTDPGMPAPPAPGSVGPRPPVPRRATPGERPYTSEDDTPTKPDGTLDPDMLRLVRLVSDMPVVERRRMVSLVDHYSKCGLGRRVLIEELARELAGKGGT